MVSFDDVIPTLVRVCETSPGFADLVKICVVRDLKGRVRLVLKPSPEGCKLDIHKLEQDLLAELGAYFDRPIFTTDGPVEQRRLAHNLLDRAQPWPDSWPSDYEDPITGQTSARTSEVWCSFQRVLAKETWLSPQQIKPPWPLIDQAPAVVSFYSFKGGVGRTLLVGAMAWHLARAGKHVAVLDLDLEAPGLAVLLGAETTRGVIDFIVDHVATGSSDIRECYGMARALGDEDGAHVDVFPAGRLTWRYLEKLARLDFAASDPGDTEQSPTARALEALLKCIRSQLAPDVILLDSRAGLHDLGGLSLHALSHVDVLVSRAGEQGYQGLALTLQALHRRKREDDFYCILVHTFAPPAESPAAQQEECREVRERAYDLFSEYVYAQMEGDEPGINDRDAPHYPWVITQYQELERVVKLHDGLAPILFSSDFEALCTRILELCTVPEDSEES